MTRRLQIRIMATFVIVLLVFLSVFLYDKIVNAVTLVPTDSKMVKAVTYTKSDKFAILEIRWKQDMVSKSVKNPDNYLVEHVIPIKGKWFTAVDGKKCNVSFVQHVPDPLDKDKKGKVTQISLNIDPKEKVDDYFRVRIRNVRSKSEKLSNVEYGVAKVSSFANFTKK
ncbi:MAG: hypothetical protein U0457_03700 [Candidatus Sericytochromatia bacterium]